MKKLTKTIILSSLCITTSIPAFGMEKNHDFDSFFGRPIGRGKLPMPNGQVKLPVEKLKRNDDWSNRKANYGKLFDLNKPKIGQQIPPIDAEFQRHRIVVNNGNHRVIDAKLKQQPWISANVTVIPLEDKINQTQRRPLEPKYVPPQLRVKK